MPLRTCFHMEAIIPPKIALPTAFDLNFSKDRFFILEFQRKKTFALIKKLQLSPSSYKSTKFLLFAERLAMVLNFPAKIISPNFSKKKNLTQPDLLLFLWAHVWRVSLWRSSLCQSFWAVCICLCGARQTCDFSRRRLDRSKTTFRLPEKNNKKKPNYLSAKLKKKNIFNYILKEFEAMKTRFN